jgi:trans-aconitate methyltransferase
MSAHWQRIGEEDPYWGVLSTDDFHADRLSEDTRAAFFKTGQDHLEHVLATIRLLRPAFQPRRALDFGCGVGRVTIAMTRTCPDVVGVDVSAAMLAEARRNAERAGVSIQLRHHPEGTFDFIHAHIVFQHIKVGRGLQLARDLVSRLNSGGAGMLNFPYWREASSFRKLAHWLRSCVPFVHNLGNFIQGKPWRQPLIMMNAYNASSLLREFRLAGATSTLVEYRDAGGYRHALFYIFKD